MLTITMIKIGWSDVDAHLLSLAIPLCNEYR